jgi:ribosomal protein L11 methyltransferase
VPPPPLRAFEVTVPARQEDLATALLWECGTTGIEVRKAARGRATLLAYFPAGRGLTARLRARLGGLRGPRLRAVPVPRVDWVARFRRGFRPFDVGGFSVVPVWLARDARPAVAPLLRIVVDPGRAFGTGTHASTRLCLRAREELARERPLGRVVDLGAGTGILSIAAARLGARSVTAVEVDPEAVASARRHARLNDVRLRVVEGDLARPLRGRRFDLVLANLTAPLLCHRAAEVLALAAPGARLVLSGALAGNVPALRRAYGRQGRISTRRDGEWAALLVRSGA